MRKCVIERIRLLCVCVCVVKSISLILKFLKTLIIFKINNIYYKKNIASLSLN